RAPLRKNGAAPSAEALLDLVALGTVADVVPLQGENRVLVQRGLALLNDSARIGLRELILKAGIKPGQVDASAIGFALGPRLNAAGRMESARTALDLLLCRDRPQAAGLAMRLEESNRDRQEKTKRCVEQARATILAEQR